MNPSTISIDLEYAGAARLLLPRADTVALVLVGCGGTGSWLAPSVARIARVLIEKYNQATEVYFFDPDVVEAKNCYRQNFCQAEIGRNKALSLAWRYGLGWGVEIAECQGRFDWDRIPRNIGRLNIIIGCVDNAEARRSIEAMLPQNANSGRYWWLDCGNHRAAGQVLVGCRAKRPDDPFQLPGFCSWLPMPTAQHPELLAEDLAPEATELACADMLLQDSQGLAVNQRIAAEATDYLVRMLLTRDLRKYATYVDLASGTTRSKYIIASGEIFL